MNKLSQAGLFMLGVALVVISLPKSAAAQASKQARLAAESEKTVTLLSLNKYHRQNSGCLDLGARPDCQIRYGALYAGDDWDWFASTASATDRTAIRDLGLLSWTDAFKVPFVEPLPKLKPGEQRHIGIDVSGTDGADGAPGVRGQDGADAGGIVRPRPYAATVEASKPAVPARPKHDGKPKIDPIFVKALAGHMYVVHVVTEVDDFYALVHVETVARGDKCTVSWRLTPAPKGEVSQAQ